jgi:DNA helicase-2/ATP-dependent DNA helicase PcrA
MVGDVMATYKRAKQICGKQTLWTLCYKNVTSNCLKNGYDVKDENIILEDIITNDSNAKRAKQLYYVISSIENARDNKIRDALKFMKRAMRKEDADRTALSQIQCFLDNYEIIKDKTLTEFYNTYFDEKVFDKSKITKGSVKDFYDSKKYSDMALAVKIDDDDCINRTIHKAKGDENNCVMVIIPESDDKTNCGLDFILNPNIAFEENRVYYVALSRAREKLYISIPKINDEVKDRLMKVGFEIENCS